MHDGHVEVGDHSARLLRDADRRLVLDRAQRLADGQRDGQVGPLASETALRAMSARMSAQETVPEHAVLSWSMTRVATSKPRRLPLGSDSFSAVLLGVESRSTEASHHVEESMMQVMSEMVAVACSHMHASPP